MLRKYFVLLMLVMPMLLNEVSKSISFNLTSIYGFNKFSLPLFIVFIYLIVVNIFDYKRIYLINKRYISVPFFLLLYVFFQYSLYNVYSSGISPFIRVTEFLLPIFTALLLFQYSKVNQNGFRYYTKWIFSKYILIFIVYLFVSMFWWYVKLRFVHLPDPTLGFVRLRTPYLGAVSLSMASASIPLLLFLLFKKKYLVFIPVVLYGLYLTGTRTGLFTFFILLILLLFGYRSSKYIKYILSFVLVNLLLLFSLNLQTDRFLSLETSRTFTQIASIKHNLGNSVDLIFGQGLGAFYPYDKWYAESQSMRIVAMQDNSFSSENLLVEPHSFYVWIIVELGIVGIFFVLFLFTPIAISAFRDIINKNATKYIKSLSLYILSLLICSFSGSFLLNEPYLAFPFWYFLFIYLFNKRCYV